MKLPSVQYLTGAVAVASVDSLFAQIERDPARSEQAMPAGVMRVSTENERVRFTVYFSRLDGITHGGTRTVNCVKADCFVILK